MNIPTLTTKNLVLRPFSPQDDAAFHDILNGQDVLRYFPKSDPLSLAQIQRAITNMLKHWGEHGYGLWAVESRADRALMGRCGLQYLAETDEVEVDFILGRQFWGQGAATEGGRACLDYGFETLQVPTIVGIVHQENIASQRVLEKIGMTRTKAADYFGMPCYRYAVERAK